MARLCLRRSPSVSCWRSERSPSDKVVSRPRRVSQLVHNTDHLACSCMSIERPQSPACSEAPQQSGRSHACGSDGWSSTVSQPSSSPVKNISAAGRRSCDRRCRPDCAGLQSVSPSSAGCAGARPRTSSRRGGCTARLPTTRRPRSSSQCPRVRSSVSAAWLLAAVGAFRL
jgi:hypothetical protein